MANLTRSQRIREGLAKLKEHRAISKQQIDGISKDMSVDVGHRAWKTEQARLKAELTLGDMSARLWEDTGYAIEAATDELRKGHERAAASWDYQRLAVLQTELAVRLAQPGNPAAGESQAQRIAGIHELASLAADRHTLRALRTAATGLVSSLANADGSDREIASNLRQAFKVDAANEVPTDVLEAAADLRELQQVRAMVRDVILDTETEITGARKSNGVFDAPSPWQKDILQEDPQREMGGGAFMAGQGR